jgi:AcrR family transcriptional regulator
MNALIFPNTTEQRIRLTAIRLIARDGYEAMSLRDLASESGVNSSSLYLYYKGKRELLLSLVLGYFDDLSMAWERCWPRGGSTLEQLRAFVRCHVSFHLLRREETLIGNLESRSLELIERDEVCQARRRYLGQLRRILEQGLTEGVLRCEEPKLTARVLCNMLTHASIWYRDDGRLNMADVQAYYVDLVEKLLEVNERTPA